MSNDSSPVGGGHGFDSDALEEWVSETARQKGVSKQKLLDEILSSYWVLEELSGVVMDSSVAADSQQTAEEPSAEMVDEQQSAETVDEQQQEPPDDPQQPTEGERNSDTSSSGLSSTTEFSELKSELQGLQTAIEELSQDQRQEESTDERRTEMEFSELEGQLDDLSSAVVERQTETDQAVDALANRQTEIDKTIDALADQVDILSERLTAVESQLDDGMSLEELEAAIQQNSADHAELERQLEAEFDSIEQVLQHLLDTTDNIEYRLGAVSESRQEALKPLRERNQMHDRLTELKNEALRHGVSKGSCDHCDQKIDLGMLEKPQCPGCERRFTGISKGGWLPFSTATINTTERSHDMGSDQQSATPQWGSNDETTASGQESSKDDNYQTDW